MNTSFLPGTAIQFAVDSTSLGLFKECPRKYFYSMIAGYTFGDGISMGGVSAGYAPKDWSVHLAFGIAYHSAHECYHKRRAAGVPHDLAVREAVLHTLVNTVGYDNQGNTKKTKENLIRTIIWSLDRFSEAEPDPAKTIILSNGSPAAELSFRFEMNKEAAPGQPYLLCGHLDRLVEFQGDLWVMDYKTTGGTLSGYFFDQYNPNNQMSLYILAGQVIYNVPVRGAIIDAAQVMVGFSNYARGMTHRTAAQLEEFLDTTAYHLDQMRDCAEYVDGDKTGFDEAAWPMNDKSCDKFGGCPFRIICSKDPAVRKNFLASNFVQRVWNPLETRE